MKKMKVVSETISPGEVKDRITPDPNQPRIHKGDIGELAQNIEEVGQQEAIHVDVNYIIIDGERRWLAVQQIGYHLDIRRHTDIETLDHRDELRDILEGQKRFHHYVDRAYNWARRVIDINLVVTGEEKRAYTPPQLKEVRDEEYETLKDLLVSDVKTPGKLSGFSELARQLTKRTGKFHSDTNVREHCRMVFLPDRLLDKIALHSIDRDDPGGLELSYGTYTARLYRYPKTMKKLIDEIFDPEVGFDSVKEFKVRVQEYQQAVEEEIKEKAEEGRRKQQEEEQRRRAQRERKEKAEEDRKRKRGETEVDKGETDKGAEERAKQPTEAQKKLLDKFGAGNSLEGKIRNAKKEKVDDGLIEEWEGVVERLKPLLFVDDEQVISECTKYIGIIDTVRNTKKVKEKIEKKIQEALDLGLDVSGYRQRLSNMIETLDIGDKKKVKELIGNIDSAIHDEKVRKQEEKIRKEAQSNVDAGNVVETDPDKVREALLRKAVEGLSVEDANDLVKLANRMGWSDTTIGELKDVYVNFDNSVKKEILDDKNRLTKGVIIKLGEVKDPELQKKAIKAIQVKGYNEDKAIKYINKLESGESDEGGDRGADLTVKYPMEDFDCPQCGKHVTLRLLCDGKGKHRVEVV